MGRFSARDFTILEEGSTLGSSTVSEDDSSVALISSIFRIHQHVGRMINVKFTHSISVRSLDILEEGSSMCFTYPIHVEFFKILEEASMLGPSTYRWKSFSISEVSSMLAHSIPVEF